MSEATKPPGPVHHYRPRGSALEAMRRRDGEVLLGGPAGTGKSRAILEKLHMACLATPDVRALVVRKTLVSLTSTGLVTFEQHVAKEAIEAGDVKWFGGSPREPACYRYSNGSRLVVGGMDNPTKIMSSEYDLIYVQEAIELSEDDWEKCTTRLRNRVLSFQQLIGDTNPDAAEHWLNQRCLKGKTVMVDSRHEDNPVFFDDDGTMTDLGRDYIGRLDALTGVRHARLRLGLWVSAEGAIYGEEWEPAVHLVDRFDIPDDWRRWWVIDFGHTNPMVVQWWAEDDDGRLYRYREIYRTRRLVEDHALDALLAVTRPVEEARLPEREVLTAAHVRDDVAAGLREWIEPRPQAVVCDHDAEDRATWERHSGLKTTAARKEVQPGIEAVKARLKVQGDGRPRLFLLRDSLCHPPDERLTERTLPWATEQEVPGYVWAKRRSKGAGGELEKEEPLKEHDHGCDAMRYLVSHRDRRSGFRVRTLG